MILCNDCGKLGGGHSRWCASRIRTAPAPSTQPREYRIEWFGSLQVHQPIRPTVHQAATEVAAGEILALGYKRPTKAKP